MTSPLGLLGLDPWSPSPPQAESARLVRFASPGCSTQGLSSLSNDSAMGTRVLQGSWLELGGTSTRFNCSALSRRLLSKPEGDDSLSEQSDINLCTLCTACVQCLFQNIDNNNLHSNICRMRARQCILGKCCNNFQRNDLN